MHDYEQAPAAMTLWATEGPVAVIPIEKSKGNELLDRWGHSLGPCNRPFGQDHWALVVNGCLTSVAVTASTVSPTVTDEAGRVWPRKEVAELARICTKPGENWATRPMLRFWREVLIHRWTHWPVSMAVSYATPGKAGHIYRHDGWVRVREVKRSNPGAGSTWSKPSATDTMGDGRKTLWVYRHPTRWSGVDVKVSATAIETYDSPVDKPVEDLLKRAAARAEKSLAERNLAILTAYAEGAGLREIARAVNMTHPAVKYIVDKAPNADAIRAAREAQKAAAKEPQNQ